MKARAILRRAAVTFAAAAAVGGGIGLSAGTAQAQPNAHRDHSGLFNPQPSDGGGGPPFGAIGLSAQTAPPNVHRHHSGLFNPQPGDGTGGPVRGPAHGPDSFR